MVRAALTPKAECAFAGCYGTSNYMEMLVQIKDEVMIQVIALIGLERFYDIWNVIYPKHRERPYCDDIPGYARAVLVMS
jgi:hypothetical protein